MNNRCVCLPRGEDEQAPLRSVHGRDRGQLRNAPIEAVKIVSRFTCNSLLPFSSGFEDGLALIRPRPYVVDFDVESVQCCDSKISKCLQSDMCSDKSKGCRSIRSTRDLIKAGVIMVLCRRGKRLLEPLTQVTSASICVYH